MRRVTVGAFLAVAVLMFNAPQTQAFMWYEDGIGGSWYIHGGQNTYNNETLPGAWDYVRIDWLSGSRYFESLAFRDWTGTPNMASRGWTNFQEIYENGNLVTATMAGPELAYNAGMYFGMWFTGTPGPIEFCYSIYDRDPSGDTWVAAQHFQYNGIWTITDVTQDQCDPGVIPEPATCVLLGLLIAGAGIYRRFRQD